MRNYLVFCLPALLATQLSSQTNNFCGSDELLRTYLKEHPEKAKEYLARERVLKVQDSIGLSRGNAGEKLSAATVYTIPVVFHVLHKYGAENISDAQIHNELDLLNKHYRKLNADTINVMPPFQPADSYIEFRLATRDTNGNCVTGIMRHYDTDTHWASPAQNSQYKYTWDPTKYLNIYLVSSITGFAYGGYSSFPGFSSIPARDVIVVTHDCIGTIGTSNPVWARILTHEIGHFLNLRHVWGNTAFGTVCGDDGVSDTPITKGNSGCPSTPPAVCNPTVPENNQNHMDYGLCPVMFTAGQAARMATALNSPAGGRNNLWTNSNLISTGVINPAGPCPLIADCYSTYLSTKNVYTVCAGNSLLFTDATYNGTVTGISWSVTGGGVITNFTAASTQIKFPAAGTYTVTLSATGAVNTAVTTRTVLALSNIAEVGQTYMESFEGPPLPPKFTVINPNGDVTWAQTTFGAASGSKSYFIDGSSNPPGSIDILETPTYDFAGNPGVNFTFKVAYARYSSTITDIFMVQASKNCGITWSDVFVPGNAQLAQNSGGIIPFLFYPQSSEFTTYTLTSFPAFGSFLSEPAVRLRFYFKEDGLAGFGNNIFLDDINFGETDVAAPEISNGQLSLQVYPNPASDQLTLKLGAVDMRGLKCSLIDLLGRDMGMKNAILVSKTDQQVSMGFPVKPDPGVYFLKVENGGKTTVRKIVFE